jgi:hypothetical protein
MKIATNETMANISASSPSRGTRTSQTHSLHLPYDCDNPRCSLISIKNSCIVSSQIQVLRLSYFLGRHEQRPRGFSTISKSQEDLAIGDVIWNSLWTELHSSLFPNYILYLMAYIPASEKVSPCSLSLRPTTQSIRSSRTLLIPIIRQHRELDLICSWLQNQ